MTIANEEVRVSRKVYRRLVWFLVLLFVCSYLDRINMSFAALSMNRDLGLSATMFGIANSAFYIAYVVAEIPSNLAMKRVGARLWIPRIMITWGLASAACMFATGPTSLYVLRALVGLAEAGFLPGVLLYMTYWFPAAYRARASSMFIMAQPLTIVFGSSLSGAMLGINGVLGIAGWRWLFLLEGLPSIVLGVLAYFVLRDRPRDATWLSEAEKATLETVIARDDAAGDLSDTRDRNGPVWPQLLRAPVILLASCYFGLVMSLSANSTWVPQIVRGLLPDAHLATIGLVAAVPSLVAIVVMVVWGAHSDRTRERAWHVALPMIAAAIGWLFVGLSSVASVRFAGLVLCAAGAFAAQAIFWTLAPRFLSKEARPVGIAAINVVGMLGTAVGPVLIGALRDWSGGFGSGLSCVAACVGIGAACVIASLYAGQRADVTKHA